MVQANYNSNMSDIINTEDATVTVLNVLNDHMRRGTCEGGFEYA